MGPRYIDLITRPGRTCTDTRSSKFWHHELVRLKYHNPAIPMTIDRTAATGDPATMTIFFAPKDAAQTSGSSTGAPAPTSSTSGDKAPSDYTPAERTGTIDMTHRTSREILNDLVSSTKATLVEPTEQEREELASLEQARQRSERESKISKEVRDRKKREEALLAQARGEMVSEAA